MYYINNNIYVAGLGDMVSVISDMGSNAFSKRNIYYVTDNEGFLPIEDLERELNYYNIEFIVVPSDIDIKTLGKGIIVYDDKRANNYPYSHYKTVFKALELSDSLFKEYASYIGLQDISRKELVKVSVSDEDSKDVPLDLLLFVLARGEMNKKTTEMLDDKMMVSIDKMKQEQVTLFITRQRALLQFLVTKNENFAKVVKPLIGTYNSAEDFNNFVTVLEQEYDNLAEFVGEKELEDLRTNYETKELCDKIMGKEEYYVTLKRIINESAMYFFDKRTKRLNYVRM